jgi:glycosyltransferase involved in cell wall biosynthesis
MRGFGGHFWEQTVLPRRTYGQLLWSPSNSGPLLVKNQVLTVHDLSALDHPEWFSPTFVSWYRFFLPKLVRRVRRVIAVSEFTKTRLVGLPGADPNKIEVVLNGVDQRFCPEAVTNLTELASTLKLPSREYLLSVGSLEPRKNLPRLLDAWRLASPSIPKDVWLIVAGGIGATHVFRAVDFGRLPQRVHFTGYISDAYLPALYSGALAFVYPSLYEGFGLPPLEAMASGTPPITGNRTSLPEVVGNAGLAVDPYDSAAIAEAIEKIVNNVSLRTELRRLCLTRAKHFTWDKTADETCRVLNSCSTDLS